MPFLFQVFPLVQPYVVPGTPREDFMIFSGMSILLSRLPAGNAIMALMSRRNQRHCYSGVMPSECLADLLHRIVRRAHSFRRRAGSHAVICVLATGGLDSSLLAALLRSFQPRLYFARVLDKTTQAYNAWSMRRCRFLADTMALRFSAVCVTREDYRRSYARLRPVVPLLARDKDIAAVDVFFRMIAQQCKTTGGIVVSGMGMNELCDMTPARIFRYYRTKAAAELRIHRRLARAYGLSFWAPWLDAGVVRYFASLPPASRKNKKILKETAAALRLLPASFLTQPSRHSTIPVSFYCGLE